MIGTLQLFVNNKPNVKRDVVSWKQVEDLTRNFKKAILPALSKDDTWQITLTIKSEV